MLPVTGGLLARYEAAAQEVEPGQRVVTLLDSSGNGNHMSSPTGATLRASGFNGLPSLDFTGTPGEGYEALAAWFPAEVTVYAVAQTRVTDSDIVSAGSLSPFFLYDRSGDFKHFLGSQLGGVPRTSAPTVLGAALAVDAGRMYVQAGSRAALSYDGPHAVREGPATGFVGRAYDGGARYMDGLISEVLIYAGQHSHQDHLTMMQWLAEKYGIVPTSYAPIGQLDGSPNLLTVAYVVDGLLDDWHRQPHLPIATNGFGRWLMARAGYTPPPGPRTVWPPVKGRGYPRGT